MPIVEPINPIAAKQAKRYGVEKKLAKQIEMLKNNPSHPSLNWELLEPKSRGLYSFRIDIKYRAICSILPGTRIRIEAVTVHYNSPIVIDF